MRPGKLTLCKAAPYYNFAIWLHATEGYIDIVEFCSFLSVEIALEVALLQSKHVELKSQEGHQMPPNPDKENANGCSSALRQEEGPLLHTVHNSIKCSSSSFLDMHKS